MKSIRRILVLLLALLMAFGAVVPAYAEELDNEDELIAAALAGQEEYTAPVVIDGELPDADDETSEDATEETTEETSEKTEETTEEVAEEPALDGEAAYVWQTPGSADIDILAGGTHLMDGDAYYYAENGIWCDVGGTARQLSSDNGANLNLYDGWLYFTTSAGVRRISLADGTAETVYDCAGIEQLYVIGRALLYLADGCVFCYDRTSKALTQLDAPADVTGLIPTQQGIIYLTGSVFDRCVWVGGSVAFEGVESCYTDSGYLIVNRGGTYQIALDSLFSGVRTLADYSLHQNDVVVPQMSEAEAMAAETAYFDSEEYAALSALGEQSSGVMALALDGASSSKLYITAQQLALSSNDKNAYNITLRARQHAEVLWTPLQDRYAWGARTYHAERTVTSKNGVTTNYFKAGETYQGIPYSQAVYTSAHPETGYVGWQLSVSKFVDAVNDSRSKFYSGYSTYGQTAPYYGSDCAAFVATAWDLPYRCTCSSLVNYSKYIGSNLNQIQLGDCLNKTTSHVVLVTDIGYDYNGNIVSIEITEQTPLRMKVTNYGEPIPGKSNEEIYYVKSLSSVQSWYLNNGYYIYRRSYSGSVDYEPERAIALVEDGWTSAPQLSMSANADGTAILVTLSHIDDIPVRYTTDGSQPTLSSPVFSQAIAVSRETTIRAIADHSNTDYTGSFELIYTVAAEKADRPVLACVSGALSGTTAASGSVVTLTSGEGASIYYTTDGSQPTLASPKLGEDGIKIDQDVTLRAIAIAEDRLCSEEARFDIKVGTFHNVTVKTTSGGTASPTGTVQVLDGESQQFTFTASNGYKIADVLVDGKSVGAVKSHTISNVKGEHSIEVKFAVDLPFTDVKATAWYADAVAYSYTNSLLKGITATVFGTQEKMTRGQFATLLGRYAGQSSTLESMTSGTLAYTNGYSINVRKSASTSSTAVALITDQGAFVKVLGTATSGGELWYKVNYNGTVGYVKAVYNGKNLLKLYTGKFKDIAGQYYNGYIQWAYYNKIINGMSDTSFGSELPITRQDLCVMLYRYLTEYLGKTLATGNKKFTDEAEIKSYAATAVHALANIGVINGYTDGSFAPTECATRAEVATMFMNLDNYLKG